ncbi:MAG: C-terminal binding protein [Candidatus Latescibacteria bacterium]|jgi:D-3-phosphoglycerate dehydrogenase/C-terminal binding protein|nr:C-terminal binding protein [Candidatus Latescibacterota bacterium]
MSSRFKVVITDFVSGSLDPEQDVLGDLADVTALTAPSEDSLAGHIEDADAVIVYHFITFSRRSIQRLRQCRVIVRGGVGYDNIDHAFARERGIPVCIVPDYGTEEVADSALGLTLSLTRGVAILNSTLRAGEPWSLTGAMPLERLRGRVFAIVGLGRIGTAAAVRAKAFGMDVAFTDPYKPDGYDKSLGVRRIEALEDLLEQAHVLSVHCPLTPETSHLIDAQAIARMRRRSYLVNTARGEIVDTGAVADAVASGHLEGAGIDVFETEPPDKDDPLIRAWRDPEHPAHHKVLITPHSAFYAEQSLLDLRTKAAEACRRVLLGQSPRNVVNA